MAASSPGQDVKDLGYRNWLKVGQALLYMKRAVHSFVRNEVNLIHKYLIHTIYGGTTVLYPNCTTCKASDIKQHKQTKAWGFITATCPALCHDWLTELLNLFDNPRSDRVYWSNCDVTSWAYNAWECAKAFMPRGQKPSNTDPTASDAQALLTLMANCKHFHRFFSPTGIPQIHKVSDVRNTIMHAPQMKLTDTEMRDCIQEIIDLLEDPKHFHSLPDCIAAVSDIKKIRDASVDVFLDLELDIKALRELHEEAIKKLQNDFQDFHQDMDSHKSDLQGLHQDMDLQKSKLQELHQNMDLQNSDLQGLHQEMSGVKERRKGSRQPTEKGVPVEILNMDHRSIQLFEDALKDGKETVHSIRVMVVGHIGVGKTTLVKRLLGEEVNLSERCSTEGIDVYVNCCDVSLSTGEWTRQGKDTEQDYQLQRLARVLNEQQSLKDKVTDDELSIIPHQGEITVKSHEEVHVAVEDKNTEVPYHHSPQQDIDQDLSSNASQQIESIPAIVKRKLTQSEKNTLAMIKLLHDNAYKLKQDTANTSPLTVWDFAGQFAFYTTHQTFLTRRAIYILVSDVSEQLTDLVADDCFFDSEGKLKCKVHDLLEVWINLIHSCATSAEVGIPPVILVGTHVDQILLKNRHEICERYFKAIRTYLSDKPTRFHLVDEDFAIDNTVLDSKLEDLKRKIVEVASKQSYWGEVIPARWLPLEQELMRLKAAGIKVIARSIIDGLNKAEAVPIATDELDLFLRFHHDIGTILYFSIEILKEKIVLDPQWMIDALKSLITAEMFVLRSSLAVTDKWFEFKNEGKLSQELVDALWTKEKHQDLHDNKEHMLLLMEQLNIIAKLRVYSEEASEIKEENCFLAPCMLSQQTPKEVICPVLNPQMESSSVICYVFLGKYLPFPIFHRLLAACVARWPIATKKNEKILENQIFCGCCVFQLEHYHKLTIHFRDYIIYMRVTRMGIKDKTPSSKLCIQVREFVSATLIKIIGCLGQSLKFEYFIQCPEYNGDSINSLIPVSLLKENTEVCCEFHNNMIESYKLLQFWFEDTRSHGENAENTGVNKNKAGLMKAETDQTEAVFVHRILVQQAMSVGIIRSPSICGTGFRVGSCYIMTAKHVIDKIMVAAVPLGQQIKQRHPLSNRDVFIDFSYEMDERTSSESLSFHFEPTIIYSNDELDTVILQLKHDNTKMYPPPLTKFTLPPENESHGYFIGHSKGKIKKTDKYKCVTLNPHEIAAAREWSVKRVNVDGFVGIDDSRRVLLHCSFENGASGSPGFWIDSSSGKAYVLMMLLCGYPDWYYDENYKDKTIGMLPKDLIEQGVYMTAIYDDLNKRNTVLCQEIFNFHCDDVEMVYIRGF